LISIEFAIQYIWPVVWFFGGWSGYLKSGYIWGGELGCELTMGAC
jgi:hypothetical protein